MSNMILDLNRFPHIFFLSYWFPAMANTTSSSSSPPNPGHPNPCFDNLTNPAHPLFLHPSENLALVLVSHLLSDNNYPQWRYDMLVALETKNKDCFVIDTLPCPPFNDPLHEAWKRCNKIVISWLTRSMTPAIKQSVMWMEFASDIWIDLLQRFSRGDKFRIADL